MVLTLILNTKVADVHLLETVPKFFAGIARYNDCCWFQIVNNFIEICKQKGLNIIKSNMLDIKSGIKYILITLCVFLIIHHLKGEQRKNSSNQRIATYYKKWWWGFNLCMGERTKGNFKIIKPKIYLCPGLQKQYKLKQESNNSIEKNISTILLFYFQTEN